MTDETQNKENYTLSTFRDNWRTHGFWKALKIDDEVTTSRYEAPTLSDIHKMGKATSREVGGVYTAILRNPNLTAAEQAAYLVCASVGYPVGYFGGLLFGALGVKAKSLEAEVTQ